MDKYALALTGLLFAAIPAWAAVDVNTATREQLEAEGMGPVAAQAIVDYRTTHGPFKSADEVRKVIDEAIAAKLSIGISISGPPPAHAKPTETKPDAKDGNEVDNVRNRAKKDQDDRKT